MLAAPSYDGTITVWHASSLSETCKLGLAQGINVFCIYMSYDALVQRARNDIVKLALETNVDELVFVDCDIDWKPEDFIKLVNHDADIVGAVYPKKYDEESYPVKLLDEYKVNENNLVEVDGLPMGFTKIKRKALELIWDNSKEYREPHKEHPIRMVFDININEEGYLVSEDISFCDKWKSLGGKLYLDPTIDLAHVGTKRWIGNFSNWIEKQKR